MKTSDRLAPVKSFFITALCQMVGATFSTGLAALGVPFLLLFVIHSFISGYLSIFLGLSAPWRFLNFMIPAGLLVSVAFPGYGWVWFTLMIVFALIFLPTFWTRVPYYPSSIKAYELVAAQLPKNKPFSFIDLGCGDGKLLSYLASSFPLGSFSGFDLSPSAVLAAKTNNLRNKNVTIRFGDYWKESLSDFDFIYAFLSPTPMAALEEKAKKEIKKGAKLLINSFELPNMVPSEKHEINHKNQSYLLIYGF